MSTCQQADCHEEAVRTLTILANGRTFPGAVDVTDRSAA